MTQYKIAGLIVEIDNGPIKVNKELDDFALHHKEKTDILITIKIAVYENQISGELVLDAGWINVYETSECFIIKYKDHKLINAYVLNKASNSATIYVSPDSYADMDTYNVKINKEETEIDGPQELLYAIQYSFYYFAGRMNRIPIHSASIVYRERVWLFSAPSGTGKSYHVNQWHKLGYDIQDFNGDVAIIYEEDGIVKAANLPWSGTSGIYNTETLPLGGIFFLKRGEEDHIRSLDKIDGSIGLIARSFLPNWNRSLVAKTADIAEKLGTMTKAYELHCTKSPNAAVGAKEQIDQDINS